MYKIRVELRNERSAIEDGFEVNMTGRELALSLISSFKRQIGPTRLETSELKADAGGGVDYETAWSELKKEARKHLGGQATTLVIMMKNLESTYKK
jgi:hypothetical protein